MSNLIGFDTTECLIAGHEGQYAHIAAIELALDLGMPNREDENGIGYAEVCIDYRNTGGTGDYCEFSVECADEAAEWLNTHHGENGVFLWADGEFYFVTEADLDEMG